MQLKLLFPFRFILFYKIFEKRVYEELLTRDINWIQPLIGKQTAYSQLHFALKEDLCIHVYVTSRSPDCSDATLQIFLKTRKKKDEKKKGEQSSFREAVFGHPCLGVSSTLSTSLPVLTLHIISVCSQFCWHNSAPLCLSRLSFPVSWISHRFRSQHRELKRKQQTVPTLYTYMECVYIHTTEGKDQTFLTMLPPPRFKCFPAWLMVFRWCRSSCCGSAKTAGGCVVWAAGRRPVRGGSFAANATPWWWSRRWRTAAAPGRQGWTPPNSPRRRVPDAPDRCCSDGPRCSRACPRLHWQQSLCWRPGRWRSTRRWVWKLDERVGFFSPLSNSSGQSHAGRSPRQ